MTRRFGDFQNEIYGDGLRGRLPRYPVDFDSLERTAAAVLPSWIWSYVAGGCGDEHTQRANVAAFRKWGIVPRMGIGEYERDLSVELFGMALPSPVFLAPVGVMGICTGDFHGDLVAARASERTGVPAIQSTLAMDPLEVTGAVHRRTPGLFQLYTPTDRELAISLLQRAERAGYKAIVVTLDTWVTGWRPRDLNTANFPQLRGWCLANYFSDERFRAMLGRAPESDPAGAIHLWSRIFGKSVSWDDLTWMRESTSLPIVVKGVCRSDDVRRAIDAGADGIYCSNHGGRQADGGLPALDALPEVVAAARGLPVLFDSGVRNGTDVVKALALGATAVGLGRSYVYAAAAGGEDGLVHHLRSVLAEADLLMAVDGYPTIADLTLDAIRRVV
ncbi:alpha-hydroxy-acid oxidizing protein [Nocardia sp. NPDC051833]|uniref:alpha-hydroxy-acid oxidizing protein n=1 Tax=Nocardia sp. NPDC051833 TaxID=3155674 RepID=UPI0034191E0F